MGKKEGALLADFGIRNLDEAGEVFIQILKVFEGMAFDFHFGRSFAGQLFQLESRRLGEEGQVMVRAQVSADGKVLSVGLKQSSGFERLDEATLKAVAKYRFTSIGRVSFVIVPIKFNLKK